MFTGSASCPSVFEPDLNNYPQQIHSVIQALSTILLTAYSRLIQDLYRTYPQAYSWFYFGALVFVCNIRHWGRGEKPRCRLLMKGVIAIFE